MPNFIRFFPASFLLPLSCGRGKGNGARYTSANGLGGSLLALLQNRALHQFNRGAVRILAANKDYVPFRKMRLARFGEKGKALVFEFLIGRLNVFAFKRNP